MVAKGFTIIELLVIVALIGLLSSIILTGLQDSKQKANDAVIKESLATMKSSAELHYAENNNSYEGVCEINPASNVPAKLYEHALHASGWNGNLPDVTYEGACLDEPDEFITMVIIHKEAPTGCGGGPSYNKACEAWCVDSYGNSVPIYINESSQGGEDSVFFLNHYENVAESYKCTSIE